MKLVCIIEPIGKDVDARYYRETFGLDVFKDFFDDILLMGSFPDADIRTKESTSLKFGQEGRKILKDMARNESFAAYCSPIYWGPYMTKGLGIKTFVRYGLSIENLRICKREGCNHVHYLRYLMAKHTRNQFWHSQVYFIAVSQYLEQELLQLGVSPNRIAQIYAVSDTSKFVPKRQKKQQQTSFFYGIQDLKQERKRPETLLEAAQLLDKEILEKIKFTCTGYNQAWFSKKLGPYKKYFELPGILSQPQLIERLQQSTYGVHSTRTEGFPRIILQGMSCGLPFLANPVGGIPELVDAKTGFLFETPAELAERIAFLVEHPEKREQLSKNSRDRIVRLEQMVKPKYKELFTRTGIV